MSTSGEVKMRRAGRFCPYWKRLFGAYGQLLATIGREAPVMVAATFLAGIAAGLVSLLAVYATRHIFDDGLLVASGAMTFRQYAPYLALFVLAQLLPGVIADIYIYSYVQPRSQLILRTSLRAQMLRKIERMKYEHFEEPGAIEVMDKAFNRADNSARHMFPMYVTWTLSSMVTSVGLLCMFGAVRWWLVPAALLPAAAEILLALRANQNIYDELELYWAKERRYRNLGDLLKGRDAAQEMRMFGSADYLINAYGERLGSRNREYERFYYKHLRRRVLGGNITKLATIGLALLLLLLYLQGALSLGAFIALTLQVFNTLFAVLNGSLIFFRASGMHINFFDYYNKYLNLSEEPQSGADDMPERFDVAFEDVWFRYPGTDRDVLRGVSFRVPEGGRVSLVGENGEGKSTLIKLLLGLFTPDRGRILVGGRDLSTLPSAVRARIFGPVFQDFSRYGIPLSENIGVGDVDRVNDRGRVEEAAAKGKVDSFAAGLPQGYDTVLGRAFEGGVDISGGQWQRVAIARAFMGDKPVLLLDEPTAQLDPMAESQLYEEFAQMAQGRTALLITHRLGSTRITERIFVLSQGRVAEEGSHEELMAAGGIYAEMFRAQRKWYVRAEGGMAGGGVAHG